MLGGAADYRLYFFFKLEDEGLHWLTLPAVPQRILRTKGEGGGGVGQTWRNKCALCKCNKCTYTISSVIACFSSLLQVLTWLKSSPKAMS